MNPKLTFLHVRIYQLETESVSFLMWTQVKNSVDQPDDAAGGREELEVALWADLLPPRSFSWGKASRCNKRFLNYFHSSEGSVHVSDLLTTLQLKTSELQRTRMHKVGFCLSSWKISFVFKSFGDFMTFYSRNLFSTSGVYHTGITSSSFQSFGFFCCFLSVVQRMPPPVTILNFSNCHFSHCIIGNNSHLVTQSECRASMQMPEQEMPGKLRIKDNKI